MDELVEVSAVIEAPNEQIGERDAQKQAVQAHQGPQNRQKTIRTARRPSVEVAASSVRLATAAARHTWNRVLVRPK
jgi:hypothetical protein